MNIKHLVEIAKERSIWTLGNKILYDLCKYNPGHKTPEEIVAKIWLIGRSYAAAIERRKNKTEGNDNFYEEVVVEALINSDLDLRLKQIKICSKITENNVNEMLEVHKYLVDIFYGITEEYKRSLASKYLHFHLPNLFYIYDSRANNTLKKIKMLQNLKVKFPDGNYDNEYAKFSKKMYLLQMKIHEETGTLLTPRELDNILLKENLKRISINRFPNN